MMYAHDDRRSACSWTCALPAAMRVDDGAAVCRAEVPGDGVDQAFFSHAQPLERLVVLGSACEANGLSCAWNATTGSSAEELLRPRLSSAASALPSRIFEPAFLV